jgi:hypothetical protein
MHLVRHKVGVEFFVKSQRTDRTGVDRDNLPQSEKVNMRIEATAQALINISRKRLCGKAASATRAVWNVVKDTIASVNPELAKVMVPECVYRGFCPELKCCRYIHTGDYKVERSKYTENGVKP